VNKGISGILGKVDIKRDLYKFTLIIEMVVIFITFQMLTDGLFMTTRNLSNLLMQGVTCSMISITMMLVIVSTNADLSAGVVLGFMGTTAAQLQVAYHFAATWSIASVLLIGLLIGLWHGYWIAYKKLPAFIVTLASQLIVRGFTLAVGQGRSIGPMDDAFSVLGRGTLPSFFVTDSNFNDTSLILVCAVILVYICYSIYVRNNLIKGKGEVSGILAFILKLIFVSIAIFVVSSPMVFYNGLSYAVLLLILVAAIFHFVVKNTSFGRHVFAIGGNTEAARLSGINIEWTIMLIYILHTLVTAIAAIIFLGRVGQATPSAGVSFEFTAITGCVVGGTSILGGRGNVIGAVIGTMLMAALDNGMSLMNLGPEYQYIIKGLALMLAIAMDVLSQHRKS